VKEYNNNKEREYLIEILRKVNESDEREVIEDEE
jgi:hypothetical protein